MSASIRTISRHASRLYAMFQHTTVVR